MKKQPSVIVTAMLIEWRALGDIHPYPKNARVIPQKAIDKVARSIEEFGWRQPIVVDVHGVIVAGHVRLAAAQQLKLERAPVHVATDLTPEQIRAYRLMDNRSADEASWDLDVLRSEMLDLKGLDIDLSLTGFDVTEIANLMRADGLTEPDAVPDLPEAAVSRLGDLWILGDHRLLCGDATEKADMATLTSGQKADFVFTDPPYGVAVASRVGTRGVSSAEARGMGTLQIENDQLSISALTKFLRASLTLLLEACRKGACWYVTAPHGPMGLPFTVVLYEIGVWRHSLIWVKDSLVMGRMDYHYRHEPIYYGWTPGAAHNPVPSRDQDTIWEFPRPRRSLEHPTMKPVELIERALTNSSKAGDLVLDPFGGSGSTLIACERTGRRGYLLELDPRYADVIVSRWEQYSGKLATLAATSTTFEQTRFGRRLQTQDELKEEAVQAVKPGPVEG